MAYYINKSNEEKKIEEYGIFFTKHMKSKLNEVLIEKLLKKYEIFLNKKNENNNLNVDRKEGCQLSDKDKQRYDEYLDKNKKIFPNSEMLFNYIDSFEVKNLLLLKEYDKKRGIISELNQTLKKLREIEEKYECVLLNQLKEKKSKLSTLQNKYQMLLDKKTIILNQFSLTSKSIILPPRNKNFLYHQYKIINRRFPIEFSFLTNKLFSFIDEVLSICYENFSHKDLYKLIKEEEYQQIKLIKFNHKNQNEVYSICLKLLTVYEYIICIVLAKNNVYMNNKDFFGPIEELMNENAKRKKIEHARIARENIQKKQEENMKEIIDKKNKVLYIKKRMCIDGGDYMKREKRFEIATKKFSNEKKGKKNINENSFEEYITYSEKNY